MKARFIHYLRSLLTITAPATVPGRTEGSVRSKEIIMEHFLYRVCYFFHLYIVFTDIDLMWIALKIALR